jgi:putative membrane protein
MRFSEADHQMLARCVMEVELRTDAEVVLVARRASGSYRDVDARVGAATAFLVMLLCLFAHFEVPPLGVPIPVLGGYALGAWTSRYFGLGRAFASRKRKEGQVVRAAEACFFEKGVHRTESRLGILVYLSELEKSALILVDHGIEARLDAHLDVKKLQHFCRRLTLVSRAPKRRRARALGEFLRSFGVFLGHAMPAAPKFNERHARHELSNAADLDDKGEGE